jgi:hypothetical protein
VNTAYQVAVFKSFVEMTGLRPRPLIEDREIKEVVLSWDDFVLLVARLEFSQ